MSPTGLQPALERFRRRAGLSAGVSAALAAVSTTAAIAECIRWYWFTPGPDRLSTVVPAALTAGVIAVAVAWLRRPPLREVARAIDARLSLQAVIVTAFQCRDERDAFAVRTVTRAAQALSASRPADVYPWRLSRAALGLIASSVAVWLAMLMAPGRTSDTNRWPGGVPGSSPGGVPGQAAPATARPGVSRSTGGTSPESRPATVTARTAAEAARTMPPPRTTSDAAQAPGGGGRAPGQQGVLPLPSRAAGDRGGTNEPQPSRAEGGGSASLTSRDAPGQPGSGATAQGGGRRGTGAGSPATNPATGKAGADGESSGTGQPSTAKEQALALDRVPMKRRTYVQRYLQSLRAAEPR